LCGETNAYAVHYLVAVVLKEGHLDGVCIQRRR
jgi:hypothetical protein